MFRAYKQLKLAIVLYASQNQGGAWRSIITYHRHMEQQGEHVRLINRMAQRSLRQVTAAILATQNILLNGLDSFRKWEAILLCLLRRDCLIYLHETEYMIEQFQRTHPIKWYFVAGILRRNPILAVSEQAAKLYKSTLSARTVQVVRECVPETIAFTPNPNRITICMVGTIDERKGASLFSHTADLAKKNNLPWDFHWIGPKGSQEEMYLSKNVYWHGWQDNPSDFVAKANLFFLSSIDDPFPLVCLEAIRAGVGCVVYQKTGVAEILSERTGCGVFQSYTSTSAMAALQQAIQFPAHPSELKTLYQSELSPTAFSERFANFLSNK